MARRDPVGIRLLTRNGHDWAGRYPLVVEAVNHLKMARSCAVTSGVCGGLPCAPQAPTRARGVPLRFRLAGAGRHGPAQGANRGAQGDVGEHPAEEPPRRAPQRAPGARLRSDGLPARLQNGLEGIVSKRLGSRYRSGRSPDWLKFKNPAAPVVKREAEDSGRWTDQ
jgi:bifunctional non-homologous end joining protein LigD